MCRLITAIQSKWHYCPRGGRHPKGCSSGERPGSGAESGAWWGRHPGPQPTPVRLVFGENSAVLGALCWCDVIPSAAAERSSHRAFPTNALGEMKKIRKDLFVFAPPCSGTRGFAAC